MPADCPAFRSITGNHVKLPMSVKIKKRDQDLLLAESQRILQPLLKHQKKIPRKSMTHCLENLHTQTTLPEGPLSHRRCLTSGLQRSSKPQGPLISYALEDQQEIQTLNMWMPSLGPHHGKQVHKTSNSSMAVFRGQASNSHLAQCRGVAPTPAKLGSVPRGGAHTSQFSTSWTTTKIALSTTVLNSSSRQQDYV